MIIELDINGARVIISGENLAVSVSEDGAAKEVGDTFQIVRQRPPTGAQIRALRKSLGLTQHQFARELGVSQGAVSKWEAEQVIPLRSAVILMADMAAQRTAAERAA